MPNRCPLKYPDLVTDSNLKSVYERPVKALDRVTDPPRMSRSLGYRLLSHNRALEAMLIATAVTGVVASIVVARSIGPAGRGTIVTLTVWGQVLGWLAI